jgi:hypothetical protein
MVVPPLVVVVVPLTMPLPAEIATPLAPRPPRDEATAQRPFGPALPPVTTVLLEPPELLTLTELLVCAEAVAAAKHVSVLARRNVFTTNLFVTLSENGEAAVRHRRTAYRRDLLAAFAAAAAAAATEVLAATAGLGTTRSHHRIAATFTRRCPAYAHGRGRPAAMLALAEAGG